MTCWLREGERYRRRDIKTDTKQRKLKVKEEKKLKERE